MSKKIQVYVEKSNDGSYWGTSQNYEGIVSTFGNSLEELKQNFQTAFADNLEIAKEIGEPYANDYNNVEDLSSFFNLIPELKISSIAKKAGLNESLVRQYKNGLAYASQEQTYKIQEAIHSLGRDLLSIQF